MRVGACTCVLVSEWVYTTRIISGASVKVHVHAHTHARTRCCECKIYRPLRVLTSCSMSDLEKMKLSTL